MSTIEEKINEWFYNLRKVNKMSKENECICGNCKHYDSDNCYCIARGEGDD